jgi:hypothetical protein
MRKAFYLSATALLGVLGYLALGQYTLPEGPGKDLVLAKCQSPATRSASWPGKGSPGTAGMGS